MIGRLLDREGVPAPLQDLRAVVIARLSRDGRLVAGNRGLRGVLGLDDGASLPDNLEGYHLSPGLEELLERIDQHEASSDDPVYEGPLHLGPEDGPARTLDAWIYAEKSELLVIAEHRVDEQAALSDRVIELNEELAEIQRELARDIQERKRVEAQLAARTQELERSNEELERFVSVVSHDLKEPLRTVSSFLELIEDRYADEIDEDATEFIRFAVEGAERMEDLIDGLRRYAKLGQAQLEVETVDLEDVVEKARRNLSSAIEDTDAEIRVGDLPTVEGDGRQLLQVFQNLMSNAINHRGGQPPVIAITARSTEEGHVVSVEDQGPGIPEEEQEDIFQIFRRGAEAQADGLGLGLAICKKIVERHGGHIEVDAAKGEGTRFDIHLPAPGAANDG